jgi:hypothetical protein
MYAAGSKALDNSSEALTFGVGPDTITIATLTHHLQDTKSVVTMVWDDLPDRIGLEVPCGTSATDSLIDSPVGLKS